MSAIQNNSFVAWCQNETANLSTSLPEDGKFLEIARRVAVVVSIIIPLIGLIANCFANNEPNASQKSALLYMTLTGNPAHLGHMAPIAAAIDEWRKQNSPGERALVSLSSQKYMESKVKRTNKIALTHDARVHILNETIKEAAKRNMFRGVDVEFWDDQEGYTGLYGCDHPESYNRLRERDSLEEEVNVGRIKPFILKEHDVYLVSGIDLCRRMGNWPNVKHAIVVKREEENGSEKSAPSSTPVGTTRIFLEAPYEELAPLSSSAIQKGTMKLTPPSLQEYFEAQKLVATQ